MRFIDGTSYVLVSEMILTPSTKTKKTHGTFANVSGNALQIYAVIAVACVGVSVAVRRIF
jgi:hypothetical protein